MKYYKDANNIVYAYESDGSQDEFIPPELIAITEEEADILRIPPPPTPPEIIVLNTGIRTGLMNLANYQISVLTDATDPDVVDDVLPSDVALLLLWKQYRVKLRAVVLTAWPALWPDQPEHASGTNATTPDAM